VSLNSKWFKHFHGTPEQKDSLAESIRNSSFVLDLLTKIIEDDVRDLKQSRVGDYDNPNWSIKTADRNGGVRALDNVLKLIKLERTNSI